LIRAARAVAALEEQSAVSDSHLRLVAPLALRHRLRRNPLDDAGSSARVERAVMELFGHEPAAPGAEIAVDGCDARCPRDRGRPDLWGCGDIEQRTITKNTE
jgi:Mg-chelatase subunit ChlI